jgi:hypothetical protein
MRTYHSGVSTSGLAVAAIVAAVAASSAGVGAAGGGGGGTPPASFSTASMKQMEALWEKAGGSQSSAVNAACHALQESGGNPAAESPNPDGGTNYGVFQLDTRGVGSGYSVAQLTSAVTNAQITVKATNDGQDWSSWATPGC